MISIITDMISSAFPMLEAAYVFGSFAAEEERAESDVDIALLLPPARAKSTGSLCMSSLRFQLEKELKRKVDLVNLRLVSTVFQKEIITTGRRFFCGDEYAAESFEMLILSFYQKLNQERAEILSEFYQTKRAYSV